MTQQPQNPGAIIKAFNQVVRNFKDTWVVLRALSIVQPNETKELIDAKQRIRELQKKVAATEKLIRSGAVQGIEERLKLLNIETRVFRELLAQVESRITTAEIRQFFQKTHETRDEDILQLLRFFRQKQSLSEIDIDKVDLLVTEACTTRVGFKRVLRPEFEITSVLTNVFDKAVPINEYEDAILSEFRNAADRIESASDIEEIVENEVIATMRSFKKEIIELFMNPRILEAALNYNVALTNKLARIFEQEEGEISKATDVASDVKQKLGKLNAGQQQTADGLIAKIREMQGGYSKKRENTGYDISLIVEAARQRKAIEKSIDKLKEIEIVEEEPEDEGFKRKTIQSYTSEIFHGLLRLETKGADSVKIPDLGIDLKKMDPWEKSLFLIDIKTLGDDQRIYEALREAVIVRSKITAEYKSAKMLLAREQVESLLVENIELAETLDKELQGYLDTYNRRSRRFSAIDLIKVKGSLSKSIKHLKSFAKMEGFKLPEK